jgi:hypothetical protein
MSLAFEYHGEAHYYGSPPLGQATSQRRYQTKQEFADKMGITLIAIPFWWNKSSAELAATIKAYRPDINISVPSNSLPISRTMPPKPLKTKPNTSKELSQR